MLTCTIIIAIAFVKVFDSQKLQKCSISNDNKKLDCHPEPNANEKICVSRGCCWEINSKLKKLSENERTSIPFCYYPKNYPNYRIQSIKNCCGKIHAKLVKETNSYLPNEILSLNFEVIYETKSRVRIRITDSEHSRYEVPIRFKSQYLKSSKESDYVVIISQKEPFSLDIIRKSDNQSLFKSFGPLLYSDQFIQITSLMSTDQVYGMGEQNRPFIHQLSNGWSRIGLWARDNGIETYQNLYGTHPFYMGMPENGKAFGVFYFNSNAQEFVLQPTPAITYRTIGGILDIFIFTGGSPEETVKQYVELVGKPMLPPFWSLGFQLSRYGHRNLSSLSSTFQRNIDAGLPIDVQYSDINYMEKYKDFTIDQNSFKNLSTFIKIIKVKFKTKHVIIIDPGISNDKQNTYSPYLTGLLNNIFIKDSITNESLVGKSWPGEVVYPDFTHPNITTYWYKQIHEFYNLLPFDGLWIDMNEPSNFYEGSKFGCPRDNKYDYPSFLPDIRDKSLIIKTICPSSLQYNNVNHYNLHNLYGYTQSICTNNVLIKMTPRKRPFVLSRSTFSGSGKYTFHWTGDNNADWDNLKNSIRQILNFNMFGIPMTGVDICGFNGNSNEELCIRWMQLGAFYPFMRNHNSVNTRDQDPASWSKEAQEIMKTAINIRYALLPTFYTLLVKSHLYGGTVMRPMSFEFYSDKNTHSLDLQFMIGSSIMVMPVVNQGATSVRVYFPAGVWYNYHNHKVIYSNVVGGWLILQSPLNTINIAIKGGSIISLLDPKKSIEETKTSDLSLLCAMNMNESAAGDLFWDDGESLNSYQNGKYNNIYFAVSSKTLDIIPYYLGYRQTQNLKKIIVLGMKIKSISQVRLNNIKILFSFNKEKMSLTVDNLNLKLERVLRFKWN